MLELLIDVTPTMYHGEQWYHAKVGIPQVYVIASHGRSPERAIGFALEKLAREFIDGGVKVETPALPDGVKVEAMDMSFTLQEDGSPSYL
jgi:hypothetical protein